MLLRFFELFVIGITIAGLVTQVWLPLVRGQQLFPFFRKQGKLEGDLAAAIQEEEESKVAAKIKEIKSRVDNS